jgi:hypothetical protein
MERLLLIRLLSWVQMNNLFNRKDHASGRIRLPANAKKYLYVLCAYLVFFVVKKEFIDFINN